MQLINIEKQSPAKAGFCFSMLICMGKQNNKVCLSFISCPQAERAFTIIMSSLRD